MSRPQLFKTVFSFTVFDCYLCTVCMYCFCIFHRLYPTKFNFHCVVLVSALLCYICAYTIGFTVVYRPSTLAHTIVTFRSNVHRKQITMTWLQQLNIKLRTAFSTHETAIYVGYTLLTPYRPTDLSSPAVRWVSCCPLESLLCHVFPLCWVSHICAKVSPAVSPGVSLVLLWSLPWVSWCPLASPAVRPTLLRLSLIHIWRCRRRG